MMPYVFERTPWTSSLNEIHDVLKECELSEDAVNRIMEKVEDYGSDRYEDGYNEGCEDGRDDD